MKILSAAETPPEESRRHPFSLGLKESTKEKYRRMTKADITCLDYSQDMLEQAESRFRGAGITNIKTMQGDVGALPFEDGTFDKVLCMNGRTNKTAHDDL